MKPEAITCGVCGIEAKRVHIDGRPWLEVPAIAFEQRCVEPSIVEEPFRCPNMLNAKSLKK